MTRVLNPADVVEWNTDKRYLRDLVAAGLPIVPTVFLEPGDDPESWDVPAGYTRHGRQAGRVGRLARHHPPPRRASRSTAAHAHTRELLDAGRTVMVQPYLEAVDTIGETAVLFIGGEFSHAIRKGPLLQRDVEGERVEGLFVQEQIDPREPTPAELDVARRIVQQHPRRARPGARTPAST